MVYLGWITRRWRGLRQGPQHLETKLQKHTNELLAGEPGEVQSLFLLAETARLRLILRQSTRSASADLRNCRGLEQMSYGTN